jgi:hypothetical protein
MKRIFISPFIRRTQQTTHSPYPKAKTKMVKRNTIVIIILIIIIIIRITACLQATNLVPACIASSLSTLLHLDWQIQWHGGRYT